MAERKKAPKQRRREKKNVPQGHVHIQATVAPARSVMVMIVLLKLAWICA